MTSSTTHSDSLFTLQIQIKGGNHKLKISNEMLNVWRETKNLLSILFLINVLSLWRFKLIIKDIRHLVSFFSSILKASIHEANFLTDAITVITFGQRTYF